MRSCLPATCPVSLFRPKVDRWLLVMFDALTHDELGELDARMWRAWGSVTMVWGDNHQADNPNPLVHELAEIGEDVSTARYGY
jgi:hypothetical protein